MVKELNILNLAFVPLSDEDEDEKKVDLGDGDVTDGDATEKDPDDLEDDEVADGSEITE